MSRVLPIEDGTTRVVVTRGLQRNPKEEQTKSRVVLALSPFDDFRRGARLCSCWTMRLAREKRPARRGRMTHLPVNRIS